MARSHHNTTHETGQRQRDYEASAKGQESRVLKFFKAHPARKFTKVDIAKRVLPRAAPTSPGRALTNLTDAGYLEKTTEKRTGNYGRPIYCWQLKQTEPTQGQLL